MRIEILGIEVDALDLEEAVQEVATWVGSGRRGYVCVTGVHGVMESQRSEAVRRAHLDARLVVPDGMPLVWCGRRLGVRIDRVYGPDLMLALLELGIGRGWRHALYGSSEEVLDALAQRLCGRFPGLQLVASVSPPYRPLSDDEARQHIADLHAARPDIVWVGLSTPKQELWMHRWHDELDVPAVIGVGAAFDFHAGLLRQAPSLLQRSGLEWAFRLAMEPRRLWRRYLRNNPAFLTGILRTPPRLSPGERGARLS